MESLKIISWNVAGFRACLKKGFASFFEEVNADIFCLQEVKATLEQYDFHPEGYYEYLNAAERKGYSGVLIYTKIKPLSIKYGIDNPKFDIEGRVITLEYEEFFLVNMYVPNVKRSLERMEERLEWESNIRYYLEELASKKNVVVCGDFNVAHTEMDIRNAKPNVGNAGFTDEERNAFTQLLQSGFIDTYRYFYPDKSDSYTWWSYMKGVRERNIGWRIDYFLVSNDFIQQIEDSYIYHDILGSDHCPIGIKISSLRVGGIL